MQFRITSLKFLQDRPEVCVQVDYLDDKDKILHKNDFIMQIPTKVTRIFEIDGVRELKDGTKVPQTVEDGRTTYPAETKENPYKRETTTAPVKDMIYQNIINYANRHSKFADVDFDGTDSSILKTDIDQNGLKNIDNLSTIEGVKTTL